MQIYQNLLQTETWVCGFLVRLVKIIENDFHFSALSGLGFESYVPECQEVLTECKHVALKKRRGSSRLENLGIPEEELLRQQQELFAQVGLAYILLP